MAIVSALWIFENWDNTWKIISSTPSSKLPVYKWEAGIYSGTSYLILESSSIPQLLAGVLWESSLLKFLKDRNVVTVSNSGAEDAWGKACKSHSTQMAHRKILSKLKWLIHERYDLTEFTVFAIFKKLSDDDCYCTYYYIRNKYKTIYAINPNVKKPNYIIFS